MKKLKASELIVGKLYWVIPNSRSIIRLRSIGKDTLYFSHHSGDDVYCRSTDDVIPFGHDNYFYEVEESLIQTMQSDINSFFAIIDITVAKLKATASEIEKLKQKP